MIKAIADKIVVEQMRRVETKGGIVIPDSVSEPQGYGLVVSVGDDVKGIKLKDVLVYHPRAGMDMLMGNKLMKTLKYEEVYGILDEKAREGLATMEVAGVTEGEPMIKSAGGGRIVKP